jgi:hypothetical protein
MIIIIIIEVIKLWTSLLMEWDVENNTNVIQRSASLFLICFPAVLFDCSVLEDCQNE